MIERVARAAFAAWRQRMIDTGERPDAMAMSFSDLDKSEREFALIHARAVIVAMREPTEAMVSAGNHAIEPDSRLFYKRVADEAWQAMIDAALARAEVTP